MRITPRAPGGRSIMDIGLMYNYKKVLEFNYTEEGEST